MRSEKGFTLMEILAVIILLAVIALITIPIITGIINESKMEAFKGTAYGLVDSARIFYTKKVMNHEEGEEITFNYVGGVESSTKVDAYLDYNGEKPKSGLLTIRGDGKVLLVIYDGSYCARKNYTEAQVVVSATAEGDCNLTILN